MTTSMNHKQQNRTSLGENSAAAVYYVSCNDTVPLSRPRYIFHISKKSWSEARKICSFNGGDLLSLDSMEQLKYIRSRVIAFEARFLGGGLDQMYWTSGNRLGRSSNSTVFYWGNNTKPIFSKAPFWEATQPWNKEGLNEECLCLSRNYNYLGNIIDEVLWLHDYECSRQFNFICEI